MAGVTKFWDKASGATKFALFAGVLILGTLLIGGITLGVLTYRDSNISAHDVAITNVTDTAYTVTWVSDDAYIGRVYFREAGETGTKWPALFAQSGAEVAYDDRDVELDNEGEYVQVEDGAQKRYTHHVTIRNLEPETEYSFRVGGSINGKETEIENPATVALIEDINTPDPGYGQVTGINGDDSFIVVFSNAGDESSTPTSTTISTNSTYTIDVAKFATEDFSAVNLSAVVFSESVRSDAYQYSQPDYKPFETINVSTEELNEGNALVGNVLAAESTIGDCAVPENRTACRNLGASWECGDGINTANGIVLCRNTVSGATTELNSVSGTSTTFTAPTQPIDVTTGGLVDTDCTAGDFPLASGRGTGDQFCAEFSQVCSDGIAGINGRILCNGQLVSTSTADNFRRNHSAVTAPVTGSGAGDVTELQARVNAAASAAEACSIDNSGNNGQTSRYAAYESTSNPVTIDGYTNAGTTDYNGVSIVCFLTNAVDTPDTSNSSTGSNAREVCNNFYSVQGVTASNYRTLDIVNSVVPPNPDGYPVSVGRVYFNSIEYACFRESSQDVALTQPRANTTTGATAAEVCHNNAANVNFVVGDYTSTAFSNGNPPATPADSIAVGSIVFSETDYACFRPVAATNSGSLPNTTGGATARAVCFTNAGNAIYAESDYTALIFVDGSPQVQPVGNVGVGSIVFNNSYYSCSRVPTSSSTPTRPNSHAGATAPEVCNTKAGNPAYTAASYRALEKVNNVTPPTPEGTTATGSVIFNNTDYACFRTPNGSGIVWPLQGFTVEAGPGSVLQATTDDSLEVSDTGRYAFFQDGERIAETDVVIKNGENVEINLYNDTNGNGTKDDGEEYISDYSGISIAKEASAEEYDLSSGWNLINIPMIDTRTEGTVRTAGDLIDYWNDQGADLAHVARFREGQFEIFSKRESGNEYADDFDLIPGEGLFVLNLGGNRAVTFSGNAFEESVPLNLSNGWNLVGIIAPDTDYNSEGVLTAMADDGIQASTISQFENGLYQSVVSEDDVVFGNNFNVVNKRGYFIKVESGGGERFTP